MSSDRVITFTPSSIGSSSSFSSSKSSLFVLDDSQSDNSMPRGDISQYNIAASPSSPLSSASSDQPSLQSSIISSTASTTQKIKRAFGKRRKQSQDASSLLAAISPANSPSSLPNTPLHQPWPAESQSAPFSQPSSAKLSMNIFSSKKHNQANINNSSMNPSTAHSPVSSSFPLSKPYVHLVSSDPLSHMQAHLPSRTVTSESSHPPPLPPPKPRLKQQSRPRSPLPSPSTPNIIAAVQSVRGDSPSSSSDHPEHPGTSMSTSEETKERWRRSDSTMDSGHTVRPTTSSDTPSDDRRVSAYFVENNKEENEDEDNILWEPTVQSHPPSATPSSIPTPSNQRQEPPTLVETASKQVKRRSLSLTIPSPSASQNYTIQLHPYHPHVSSSHTSTNSVPFTSFATAANATNAPIIASPASIIIHPPKNNNFRGRLTAWAHPSYRTPSPSPSPVAQASTSSPSLLSTTPVAHSSAHVRTPVTSDASVADLHAVGLVRQMQSRVRSPSSSSLSGSAGHIRQAATSLTNNAGAMALGFGKKAYEKVGRVWGGGAAPHTGSGSGSDTSSYHHPSPISGSPMQLHPVGQERSLSHGPSAFISRRSPNSSGSWSVPSQSQGPRSSSERDGRDTPSSFSSLASRPMGKLVRPPCASSGLVFKRELWECVKDTKTNVSSLNDPLASRMVPALIYRCVQHLHKWGLEEEGLFRISGRAGHVARLRNDFDGGADYDITDCPPSDLDPHAVASVFKAYLRELPEVILTRAFSPLFENAINTENSRANGLLNVPGKSPISVSPANVNLNGRSAQVLRKPPSLSTFALPNSSTLRAPSTALTNTIRNLIFRLPKENYDLLFTVVELIRATAARSVVTKMPLSNLLLVFCPSLSMSPTLLRVLCDVPSVWEELSGESLKPNANYDCNNVQRNQEDKCEVLLDQSDDAVHSDAFSDEEDSNCQDIVEKESNNCQEEERIVKELTDLSNAAVITYEEATALELSTDEDVILIPSKTRERKHQQQVRRVPVPPLNLQEDERSSEGDWTAIDMNSSPSISDGDQTLPHSDSTTSFHSSDSIGHENSNSQTVSRVSLLSSEDDADVETGRSFAIRINTTTRLRQTSPNLSPQSASPSRERHYNIDKSLPASPRTPTSVSAFSTNITTRRAATSPLEHAITNRGTGQKSKKSSHSKQRRVDGVGSLSTPSLISSSSASVPSVVFPSIGGSSTANVVQAPVTPTSLKKLTISLAQRNSKILDNATQENEGPSSLSKRVGRRPSLNLLFNMKNGSSGSTSISSSPRSRTPTISGPILFQNVGGGGDWEEVLPSTTIGNNFVSDAPPVLSLGVDCDESSSGWDDVFRVSATQNGGSPPPISTSSPSSLSLPMLPPTFFATPLQPRLVAMSQPTLPIYQSQTAPTQLQSLQPDSDRKSTASYYRPITGQPLPSSDFLSSNNCTAGAHLSTSTAVFAGADENVNDPYVRISPIIPHPSMSAENSTDTSLPQDKMNLSHGNDVCNSLKDLAVGPRPRSLLLLPSIHSFPSHLSFQLKGSSFEDEDWANTILSMTSGADSYSD